VRFPTIPYYVGILTTFSTIRRNFKFEDVHVTGAERIAQIAQEAGVPRLIHVSCLNASPNSASKFYKTKWEGEEKVKKAFPDATIVRPGTMYGYEDRFLNNMASKTRLRSISETCADISKCQSGPSGGS
jgi:uncharacterized protein YbjT (DUF2867 family)